MPVAVTVRFALTPALTVWLAGAVVMTPAGGVDRERSSRRGDAAGAVGDFHRVNGGVVEAGGRDRERGRFGVIDLTVIPEPLIAQRGRAAGDDGEGGIGAGRDDERGGLRGDCGCSFGPGWRRGRRRARDRERRGICGRGAAGVGDDNAVNSGVRGGRGCNRQRRSTAERNKPAFLEPTVGERAGAGGDDVEGGVGARVGR